MHDYARMGNDGKRARIVRGVVEAKAREAKSKEEKKKRESLEERKMVKMK